MNVAKDWQDYEILDMANGEKLERWKNVILVRPDPQIIWTQKSFPEKWKNVNAKYHRSSTGGGKWEYNKKMPESWQIKYKNLTFNIKPMGFKHTGLFPEQAVNWDWMIEKIQKANREIKVLNLFAYTGGATVACLSAGASVCHVDSSKGMVSWAKENVESSGLQDRKVRYLIDDVVKFVNREIRRGNKYDAIIMDPPSYGRGPNGEVWKFEKNIYNLIEIELSKYDLSVNPKSNIYKLNNSFTFLGRTYYIRNDKLLFSCRSVTYKIIVKKLNYLRSNDFEKYYQSKISYRGYLRKDIYSLKNEYEFLSNKYLNVIVLPFIVLYNDFDKTILYALV